MAKTVDITEKLNMDGNPVIVIKNKKLEVNADAATVLKLMDVIGDGAGTPKQVSNMYDLLFSEKARKTIEELKLSFDDLKIVVQTAITLITGKEEEAGGIPDPGYDLIEDYDLIVASFQSEYGIRLSREVNTMPWEEFRQMLAGLGPNTVLARMVSIRTEEDEEMLKHFTPEQRRIRCEWRNRTAAKVSIKDRDVFLEQMKQAFITMAGGRSKLKKEK